MDDLNVNGLNPLKRLGLLNVGMAGNAPTNHGGNMDNIQGINIMELLVSKKNLAYKKRAPVFALSLLPRFLNISLYLREMTFILLVPVKNRYPPLFYNVYRYPLL